MIFSWKQEMSLSESETVYRSLAITIYLNIYYKKKKMTVCVASQDAQLLPQA